MTLLLKPCPCCGGKAQAKKTESYNAPGRVIACTRCGTATAQRMIGARHNYLTGITAYITPQQAEIEAAQAWNKRAPEAAQTLCAVP